MSDIVYMGVNHWDTIRQRPQHLAAGLAKSHRVMYVDPVACFRFARASSFITEGNAHVGSGAVRRLADNLYVYSTPLAWLPWGRLFGFVNRLNYTIASLRLSRILSELDWQNDVLWVSAPDHVDIIEHILAPRICYDCMDLYSHFFISSRRRQRQAEAQEARLFASATSVLVSSEPLLDRALQCGANPSTTHVIRNAAEVEHFMQPVDDVRIPAEVAAIPGPVAGYIGTVSHWLDIALLLALLQAIPKLTVVCIGPLEIDLAPYRKVDRLHFLGRRPYEDLPQYLAGFDVLLIPFVINQLTKAVNPVKIYEYLATGIPAVATNLPELRQFQELCYVAPDHETFIACVSKALAEANDSERQCALARQRRKAASENAWRTRCDEIQRILF